jgi:phage terminase large subunit-like protein
VIERTDREEFLILAKSLADRRSNDPLLQFRPHEKQKQFIKSVLESEKTENWFLAGNRSGKSDAGAYCGSYLARFGLKKSKTQPGNVQVNDRATSGWVSCLDFPTSRDSIQPKYFDNGYVPAGQAHPPFIPKYEIEDWRVDEQILRLKNGSIIGFKSAESGRKKYQAAEKDWCHMDEEHPYDIYEESVIRVGARPLNFFCTATLLPPEGKQTQPSWVFQKIIEPWKAGNLPRAGVFGASIYDNPGISRDEIARLESIYPEGSVSRRIRMRGEWLPGMGGARAYPAFDKMLHVHPQPAISPYRPICWCWDFNVEPMVSIVGQADSGIYRVHRELILDEGSIPEMCDIFADSFGDHIGEVWLYGDATSNKRSGQTGKSDYYIILQEMRTRRASIRMKVPPDNPRVPDRVNAVNRICKDEVGRIRLQVDPSCVELIADLDGVLRDIRGGILKTRIRKDPYFRRTHTSDALGYWLSYEEPVSPPTDHVRRSLNLGTPRYAFGQQPSSKRPG